MNITGDQGFVPVKVDPASGDIDCTGAIFRTFNDGSTMKNPYPLDVRNGGRPGIIIKGGEVKGEFSQTATWDALYKKGNAAALRTEGMSGVVIRDWRIDSAWDAIRISWDCPNFLVERCWLTRLRDNPFENDRLQSGTIRNVLIDGAFSGLSVDPSSSSPVDGSMNTVVLENVLIRLSLMSYSGLMTHGSFIKTDSDTPNTLTPNIRCKGVVFAMETPDHRSYRSMRDAWEKMGNTSVNCFLLNLSDKPLPSDYPMPPFGWTVLHGAAARTEWESRKAAWIDAWNNVPAPQPEPEPEPEPEPPLDVSAEVGTLEAALAGMATAINNANMAMVGANAAMTDAYTAMADLKIKLGL